MFSLTPTLNNNYRLFFLTDVMTGIVTSATPRAAKATQATDSKGIYAISTGSPNVTPMSLYYTRIPVFPAHAAIKKPPRSLRAACLF